MSDYSRLKSINHDTLTKKCNICKIEKSVKDFKTKQNTEGVVLKIEYCCHSCTLVLQKKYRDNNKDKIKLKEKIYREKNKQKLFLRSKKYRDNNVEKLKSRRQETKEQRKILWKNWSEKNKEYRKEYKATRRDISNKQEQDRRQVDINFNLKQLLRGRLYKAVKAQNTNKSNSVISLVGCSIEDLKKHIEKQFTVGMSWENYGVKGWHMDHIIPCSYFDLSDPEQQKQCFHYANIQPLWASDNLKKSNKLDYVPKNTIATLNKVAQ